MRRDVFHFFRRHNVCFRGVVQGNNRGRDRHRPEPRPLTTPCKELCYETDCDGCTAAPSEAARRYQPGPARNKETRPGTVEDAGNTVELASGAPPAQTRMTREARVRLPTGKASRPGRIGPGNQDQIPVQCALQPTCRPPVRPYGPMVAAPARNWELYDRQKPGSSTLSKIPVHSSARC